MTHAMPRLRKLVLASSLRAGALGRALRFADRIRAGTVWINTWHKHHPNVPFGGFKASAHGCKQGAEGLAGRTEYNTVRAFLGGA